MPSFATEVKNELSRVVLKKQCCQDAELAALSRMRASMTLGAHMNLGLNFTTENAAVARRILQLLKATGQVVPEVTVSRSKRLKKKNSYFLRVAPSPQVRPLLEKLGIIGDDAIVGTDKRLLKKACCRRAYLRGAFLGGGTVNRPEASCHLEMVTGNYAFADTLLRLLRNVELPAGVTDRKNNYQIYIKDGECIMDFLAMIGADKAVEELEVARNLKEVRNQVNRLVNCETANLQKTVAAAIAQRQAIQSLQEQGKLAGLPAKLQETVAVRLANPEMSLAELAELLGVTKSCISHRLKKIANMVE